MADDPRSLQEFQRRFPDAAAGGEHQARAGRIVGSARSGSGVGGRSAVVIVLNTERQSKMCANRRIAG